MNNNIKLILSEIKDRIREQFLSIEQLGTKFNFLLAFNSILIASIFQGIISKNQFKNDDLLLNFSVFLLLFSIVIDLMGLILQKYRRDPDPAKLYAKYSQKPIAETQKILISNYIESFNYNAKRLNKVTKYFMLSIILSSTALFFIFLFLNKHNIILLWKTMTMCPK